MAGGDVELPYGWHWRWNYSNANKGGHYALFLCQMGVFDGRLQWRLIRQVDTAMTLDEVVWKLDARLETTGFPRVREADLLLGDIL